MDRQLGDNSFSVYWSDATTGNILDTVIMKRKEKPTGRWHVRNTHLRKEVVLSRIFKRMVPVDYSYQSKKKKKKKKKKKEVSGTFSFTCPVTAFSSFLSQTSNLVHRSLHLSTWSPRFTSHNLYLRCRSLASRAKRSFYFGLPKINGSNSKLSLLWLHNLEKMEKNYEDINTTDSFSVLRCFRSTGYLLLITAHERMYLLSINTKEGGTQNKTHIPSRVLLLCTYS